MSLKQIPQLEGDEDFFFLQSAHLGSWVFPILISQDVGDVF